MKKYFVLLAALGFVGCASSQKAATPEAKTAAPAVQKAAAPAADGLVTCTKGKESRTLIVVKKDKGCALNYTKAGKESAVSTSVHGTKHCDDSKVKIRKTLEKAGYKCS